MDKKNIIEGERRSFNFLSPYDTILSNKTVYEVTKKYTLKSMLDDGYEPMKNIYDLYKMSEEEFVEDLGVDMSIIELSLGSKRFYVPIDRIVDKDSESNVHYGERSIIIKLGWIPISEDIKSIEDDVKLLVEESLGITPVVGSDIVSVHVSVSEDDHNDREAERALKRQDPSNYKKKYYKLKAENSYQTNKLKALETAEINSRLHP